MKPTSLPPVFSSVPTEISSLHQWVCWRYTPVDSLGHKRWAKLPISPISGRPARSNDRNTWDHFPKAVEVCNRGGLDGIGFMFAASDPYVGVDLDNCRDPKTGRVNNWARECIRRLNTYTEVSPSGTGLKCIAIGTLPPGRRRSGNIEIYETGRYFAITGHVVNGFGQITPRPTELTELHRSLLGSPSASSASTPTTVSPKSSPPLPVPDEEILSRARHARNGQKFQRLWNGCLADAQDDHSVADLILCRILAFWCGPRPELIDRLFRCSRLHRPKWDEVHFADGRTYGEATVIKAIHCQEGTIFRWPQSRLSRLPTTHGVTCRSG